MLDELNYQRTWCLLSRVAMTNGSVTFGYDPSKTSEENANEKPEIKPINEKLNNIIKNKSPQKSVTM
jgi:hypothetical protein